MARKTLLHIKSSVVEEGRPKLPQPGQILPGEIAVNYADGYETLSIKNSNNEIATFSNDATILAYVDEQDVEIANAAGLSIVESSGMTPSIENYAYVPDEDDYYLSAATNLFEADQILSQTVLENERVTAEGLNDLNTRVNTISGNVATVQTNLTNLSNSTNAAIADIYETIENLDAIGVDNTLTKTEVQVGDRTKYILGVKIDNALDLTSPYPVANSAVSTVIKEDEEVIAAALNDLNDKFASVSGDVITVSGNISTLADTLDGVVDDVEAISGDLQTKQNILTAGTGIDITDDVISCTLDTEISQFVQTLPVSGSTSKLYFVPNSNTGATTGNSYIEYAWHQTGATEDQGEWEQLGEWTPSLTIDDELDLESTNPVENQAIASALTRIEIVTAAALNNLNDNINELSGNVSSLSGNSISNISVNNKQGTIANNVASVVLDGSDITLSGYTSPANNTDRDPLSSGNTVNEAFANVISAFTDTEQVFAAAVNDLNVKLADNYADLESLSGDIIDLASEIESITYTVNDVTGNTTTAIYIGTDDIYLSGYTTPENVPNGDPLSSGDTITEAFEKVISAMTDDERITSTALNDLNDRVDDIDSKTASSINLGPGYTGDTSIASGPTVAQAFNQVVATLGNLSPTLEGYVTPANAVGTDPLSSGDTVVVAFEKVISAITDNEEIVASAINALHDEFENFGAVVEITYSDLVTLKSGGNLVPGTWYRITDYQCTTSQANTSAATHQFDVVVLALSENTLSEEARAIKHSGDTYFSGSTVNAWKIWYCLENDTTRFAWADTTNGKGVIYRMIDEFNNDIKYDFKNILFQRPITDGEYDEERGNDTWCYTLNLWYNSACVDASIVGNALFYGVYDNIFGYATTSTVNGGNNALGFSLGCNVVLSVFQSNSYGKIMTNVIEDDFFSNTIGGSFYDNEIRQGFINNIIGKDFTNNKIGSNFALNIIGDNFYRNVIGNDFASNTIGNFFDGNFVENSFHLNRIGNYINNNTIGYNLYDTIIGNSFADNTIGKDVEHVTIGIGTGSTATTIDNVKFIHIEDGVQYVNITTTATTSGWVNLQNIVISMGIKGTSSARKTITHPTVGDTFKTTYQPANSQVISV